MTLEILPPEDDLERIHALRGQIAPDVATSAEDLRFFRSLAGEPLHVLAPADGEPAGFGIAPLYPGLEDGFATADMGVVSEHRGEGIGTALLEALSVHVAGLGGRGLQVEAGENDTATLGFLGRRGFLEVERQKAVVLELAGLDPPEPRPPAGVEIVPRVARPDLLRALYELDAAATRDIPGLDAEFDQSYDEWRELELERPARDQELSLLALAGNEVVGSASLLVFGAEGHHGLTAVRRDWRGRGLGRALKLAQIRAATERGLERLTTESEERNEPMRRLNESLGYRPAPGMVVLRGPRHPRESS